MGFAAKKSLLRNTHPLALAAPESSVATSPSSSDTMDPGCRLSLPHHPILTTVGDSHYRILEFSLPVAVLTTRFFNFAPFLTGVNPWLSSMSVFMSLPERPAFFSRFSPSEL